MRKQKRKESIPSSLSKWKGSKKETKGDKDGLKKEKEMYILKKVETLLFSYFSEFTL